MTRYPFKSTCVKSMGYSAKIRTLEVEFMDGHIYQYYSVSPMDYTRLLRFATSYGERFNQYIRNSRYPFKKIK